MPPLIRIITSTSTIPHFQQVMTSIDSCSLIIFMFYTQISVSINNFIFYCAITSYDPLTEQDRDKEKEKDSCHLSPEVKVHDTLEPLLARATTSTSTVITSHPHSYHPGDTHSHPHNQRTSSGRPNPNPTLQNSVALSDGDNGHHSNTFSLRLEPLNEYRSSSSSSSSSRNAFSSGSGLLDRNLSMQHSEELETLRRSVTHSPIYLPIYLSSSYSYFYASFPPAHILPFPSSPSIPHSSFSPNKLFCSPLS